MPIKRYLGKTFGGLPLGIRRVKSLCIASLWNKLVTIKLFLLNFFGRSKCDKMAISAYILKIVENNPFLRLQMRAKEMFNSHQFFFHK